MAEHYVVAYNGQLAEGKALDTVQQSVAQLFKVDASKVGHLFTGQWASIKKGVDESTAKKYQGALAKMGAICRVVTETQFAELKSASVEATAKPVPVASAKPQAKSPATTAEDSGLVRSVIKEAPAGLGGLEGISVEADWDHLEEHDNTPPPQVDLSGVVMAEAGVDLKEHEVIPDLDVDTSSISLDALGVDMADHLETPDLVVDTSGMVLDEPGVIMSEKKPTEPLEIDISKISLA